MGAENSLYKLLLIAGVLLFGLGVILLLYRIFRKIDRAALIEDRHSQQQKQKRQQ